MIARIRLSVPVASKLVWCLRNSYTFVALKLAWGEARRRECIRSDTRPTEQRSPSQSQRNPEGGTSFGRRRCCSLLTDPLRDMLVARAYPPPKIYCRECIGICETPH